MVFSQLLSLPRRRPLLFGLGFSCAKTSLADLLVQRFVEKREEIDVRRNAAFALFGLGYLGAPSWERRCACALSRPPGRGPLLLSAAPTGGVQYALYVPIFGRLFPRAAAFAAQPLAAKLRDGAGQRAVLAQVALDQLVHHPLMYFPAFYVRPARAGGRGGAQGCCGAAFGARATAPPSLPSPHALSAGDARADSGHRVGAGRAAGGGGQVQGKFEGRHGGTVEDLGAPPPRPGRGRRAPSHARSRLRRCR